SVFERSMPSDLIRGWIRVRVKKTHQNKNPEPRSDSIRTETAPAEQVTGEKSRPAMSFQCRYRAARRMEQ
ncbi:MAG: hypothetical protein KGL62_06220, partial [Bradyrhizobium sp.]|uniref:hypothetical protein n=1 Tax=Bradyrhizobium sp. TaxID=376 RepID=UPI002391B165